LNSILLCYILRNKNWEGVKNLINEVDPKILALNMALNGESRIKFYLLEEMAELQKEIIKDLRDKGSQVNILGEMADVYYTLSLAKRYYGITDQEINAVIATKEARAMAEMTS